MLAHKASEEGAIFAESLAGINRAINYMAVPSVIYTSPEVASVGLGEEEAKERGLELTVGSCSMIGNPRARCSGHTTGLVKILAEQHSKRVIGMHLLCQHASEMIGVGVLAIEKQMTLEELADAPSAHPTLSEAIKEAALTALGKAIHL